MARGRDTVNPYTPDSGARPRALTGRERELAHFNRIITQLRAGGTENHLLITGLRGVGKTVLLNEFETLCLENDWQAEAREIGRETSVAALIAHAARKALLRLSAKKRRSAKLRRALGALQSFELTFGDASLKLNLGVPPEQGLADSGDLVEDLRDVMVATGTAAEEAGVGFALIIDEVQNLSREDYEALIMSLHRVKQKNLPVTFVGAGLPFLPPLTAAAKTYAQRMFVYPRIGALPDEAARDALVLPARGQGVSWESEAVDEVLAYTAGYPYFIQQYGRQVWDLSNTKRITAPEVKAARPLVDAYLDDNFFSGSIGSLSDRQKRFVAAMAELGDGPQQISAIAAKLKSKTTALSAVREELIRGAVIYPPRRGEVEFAVPHCASYIRRHYSFSDQSIG